MIPNVMKTSLRTQKINVATTSVINRFFTILYFILIAYIVLDGFRDALLISKLLSWVRELTVFFLFMSSVLLCLNIKRDFYSFYLPVLLLLFSFIYGFVYSYSPIYPELISISEPLVVWYRSVQAVMIFFVFSAIERLTGKRIEFFLSCFVLMCVGYALLTPVAFYFPLSLMVENYKMWGRLGVGYPTMDAQTFCYAITAVLFIFKFNIVRLNIVLLILLAGLAMQVTGTGMASFCSVVFVFLILKRNGKPKSYQLMPLIILSVLCISIVLYLFSENLNQVIWLFYDKIDNLRNLGAGQSVDMRVAQFDSLWSLTGRSYVETAFGIGYNIYVENQYSFSLISCGVVGLVLFVLFILYLLFLAVLWRKYDGGSLLVSVIIFAMTSYTLVSLYLFPCAAVLALFYSYSMIKANRALSDELVVRSK